MKPFTFDLKENHEQAEKLRQEYLGYVKEVICDEPSLDQRDIFEAWVIQKLSNIQLAITKLVESGKL